LEAEVNTMLSDKAYELLAKSLAPKVANAIQCSDKYIEVMLDLVPDLVTTELGEMDDEIFYELCMCVVDRIYLKAT
jgi:hypothetical protein